MAAVLTSQEDGSQILVPAWIRDNETLLRWAQAREAPKTGKIGYFQGQVWVDPTMGSDFHPIIKTAIAACLFPWVQDQGLGRYYGDGMLFSDPETESRSEPDGIFVCNESKASAKVWLEGGRHSRVLYGVPDMVLEVVGKSSKHKDTLILPKTYFQVGITEYWLVDSLVEEPTLVIYRRATKHYLPARAYDGWVKSQALGASFRVVTEGEEVRLERKSSR